MPERLLWVAVIAFLTLSDIQAVRAQAAALTPEQVIQFINQQERPIRSIVINTRILNLSRRWPTGTTDNADPEWPDENVIEDIRAYVQENVNQLASIEVRHGSNEKAVLQISTAAAARQGNPPPPPAITPAQCEAQGAAWSSELSAPGDRAAARNPGPDPFVIVFDARGQLCYRTRTRVTQGDVLYAGVFGETALVDGLSAQFDPCSLDTGIRILDTTEGLREESAAPKLRKFVGQECFDDTVNLQVRKADGTLLFEHSIRQYPRYRGTVQIGVIWTELGDRTFTVSDTGSGPVVRSDFDGSRGPEYIASLVVYGLPHYLQSIFDRDGTGRYAGRDIVNENSFADRLGLAMSFGLDDPADSFGIGLSFELATGINVTATQFYRRVTVLDGLNVGDPFAGTTAELPLQESWQDEVVVGLSIDGRYLAKFFGSGGN